MVGKCEDQAILLTNVIHGPYEHPIDNFEGNEISCYMLYECPKN